MEAHSAYIPMDRRQSLVTGTPLPNKTVGAALFADISGFTPLTEALLNEYGASRGAEELSRLLNLIYDALVNDIHQYGGSVLAFSGDAVTCWLDGDNGLRATACGLVMQQTMSQFKSIKTPSGKQITLAMKVGISTGSVRRYQIGDPNIQFIDALAGNTLDVMAEAEHFAEKGDVVVSPIVAANIIDAVNFTEWRSDSEEQSHAFGVADRFKDTGQLQNLANPWPSISQDSLTDEQVCSWVLPPVYARLKAGKGEFLAELRPAVSLFLSFSGIEFDTDPDAGNKLDAYTQWVQNILVRYEGFLLQLTIGDKGCYLYSTFGAPLAHEDDAVRAVSAALELVHPPSKLDFISDVKIGISQGQMRTGAYGGTTRRTYGVLGDEVNMSARLMQAAKTGQILIKDSVWKATDGEFAGEALPPFKVKGKTDPVTAYNVTGLSTQQSIHLQQPQYTLPMVGRQDELQRIEKIMNLAFEGRGQVIAIVAEAGMGKSRLVAEVIRAAFTRQFKVFGSECQSFGTTTSYLVWQPIWQSFFNLDPASDEQTQIHTLELSLTQIDPTLSERLPLLGPVLNLSIPDNDLTHSFDAKLRKTSLESLLVACVRARAKQTPILLVLEDCHWLDPLSHDLLESIGRAIVDLPVMMVLDYRPLQLERLKEARVEGLPYFSQILLTDFTPEEAERLINLKLEQLFDAQVDIPKALIKRILDRAQGNPFYIEELINYFQDQGVDLNQPREIDKLDLPTSLNSLILSRIDKLTEHQKSTIKVASVIGRLFEAGWLWGMYPDLGEPNQVRGDLEIISRLELTPLDKPDPELSYIFKHVVTREVAYESLPYAMRAILHDQLGKFIENKYPDQTDRYAFLLAHHYNHSNNEPKKRQYLRRAGELAQAEYSNEAALGYYRQLLPLLSGEERVSTLVNSGEVLTLIGQYEDALTYYTAARFLIEEDSNTNVPEKATFLAKLCRKTAEVYERRSEYETALEWLDKGLMYFNNTTPTIEAAHLYNRGAMVYRRLGNYDDAIAWCEKSLNLAEQIKNREGSRVVGHAYYLLGDFYWRRGNSSEALQYCNESVKIYQEIDDIVGLSDAYNNLSIVYSNIGNWPKAGKSLQQSLTLKHKIGDIFGQGLMANNLAYIHLDMGEWDLAATLFEESYKIWQQIGSTWGEANLLSNLAQVRIYQEQWDEAKSFLEQSETLFNEIGSEEFLPELERRWGEYYLKTDDLHQAETHTLHSIETAKAQKARFEEGMSYRILGEIYLAGNKYEKAKAALQQGFTILTDLNSEYEASKTIIPLTRLALATNPTPDTAAQLQNAIAVFQKLGAEADLAQAKALLNQLT